MTMSRTTNGRSLDLLTSPARNEALMSLRDELARVIARDSRYSIEAYAFVLESLRLARQHKLKGQAKKQERTGAPRQRKKTTKPKSDQTKYDEAGHVTGRELCQAARRLALRHYGLMALIVLEQWGVRSTSDIGEIVFNLIDTGNLDKTPTDTRADFDDVYDFRAALRPKLVLAEEATH
jgi:uncharacterized repeat protein (TIGR04138 family)